MKRYDLNIAGREQTGKGPNYRLRQEGRIPAVLYGTGSEASKVSVEYRQFERLINIQHGANALLDLKDDKGTTTGIAIIREIQRDPVTRRFLHIDLYNIRMDQENDFEVAVHGTGVPIGVREGGILETHVRMVTVRCLPTNIPNAFDVDLLNLKMNHSLHVRDLTLPEGVSLVTHGEEVLFTVIALRAEKATTEVAAAEAPTAPEVIGKKKPDEAAAADKGKPAAGGDKGKPAAKK
jgi:large subunit ribosomal protein L25